jgi:Mg2+/citrate symporter
MAGTDEFKIQLLETFAALITAAFGLVAALAWNEAIKQAVAAVFGTEDDLAGLTVYAIIVTILAVIMTLLIARSLGKAKKALKEKQE